PLPQSESSQECVRVRPRPCPVRKLAQFLCVAAAEDDVLRLQRVLETGDDFGHGLRPFLLAEAIEAALADVVLERLLAIRKVSDLHGLDDAVDDHRGAETRAEAKEQHPPPVIAAERL